MKLLLTALMIFAAVATKAVALSEPVKAWIAGQGEIKTWSADLEQVRTLKSLTAPLTSKGRVWFEAPGRFHWELGHPAQTIAIGSLTNLSIIYPRLKRVESIDLGGEQGGAWQSALEMLEAGFPRAETEFTERYEIISQELSGNVCHLIVRPRTAMVRRMMTQMEIDFDTKDHHLTGTELTFADGSTMRNNFFNVVLNPKLDDQLFSPSIPADYKVVHPMKQ